MTMLKKVIEEEERLNLLSSFIDWCSTKKDVKFTKTSFGKQIELDENERRRLLAEFFGIDLRELRNEERELRRNLHQGSQKDRK